jgi:hypothetical protein
MYASALLPLFRRTDHFVIVNITAPGYVRQFSPNKAIASEQMRLSSHPPAFDCTQSPTEKEQERPLE